MKMDWEIGICHPEMGANSKEAFGVKIFWLRLGGFCALWAYMIIQYSENDAISILFFAMALAVYFFLTIWYMSLYLYSGLSIIIFLHGLLMANAYVLTVFLLLYITIAAAFWMKGNKLKVYTGVNLFLSITLV